MSTCCATCSPGLAWPLGRTPGAAGPSRPLRYRVRVYSSRARAGSHDRLLHPTGEQGVQRARLGACGWACDLPVSE